MTTSALKKHRIERADVVIGPYGYNLYDTSINRNFLVIGLRRRGHRRWNTASQS